jgi:hypothetical protein
MRARRLRAHDHDMTSIAFRSVADRHSSSAVLRAVAGIAIALVVVLMTWAIAVSFGASSPNSGRPLTPQNSPMPTTQEIAGHQR